MSIATTASSVTINGDGVTKTFSYGFPIPQASYLLVVYTNAQGVQSIVPPANYTATGIGSNTGGTVTYPNVGAAIASGTKITISRVVPYQQPTSLASQGAYYPAAIEAALDNLEMQIQQLVTYVTTGTAGVASFNTRTGPVVLLSSDVTSALNYTPLAPANNLSDLGSAATARTNLGLGTAATMAATAFLQPSNNLSDIANAATARTNLGLGTAATMAATAFMQGANNLSELTNAATARANLGLGTMATQTASLYALLASPAFTGTPTAPTAAYGTNTTQLATTAFVQNAFSVTQYATWNPTNKASIVVLSNGNLTATADLGDWVMSNAPMSGNSRLYCEFKGTGTTGWNSGSGYPIVGISTSAGNVSGNITGDTHTYLYDGFDGSKWVASVNSAYGSAFNQGDVIGMLLDLNANTLTFYRNNIAQPAITIPAATTWYLCCGGTVGGGGAALKSTDLVTNPANWTYSAPAGAVAISGGTGVQSFNSRSGVVSLLSADVTGALGFTPANSVNATITGSFDATIAGSRGAIEASGTTYGGAITLNDSGTRCGMYTLNAAVDLIFFTGETGGVAPNANIRLDINATNFHTYPQILAETGAIGKGAGTGHCVEAYGAKGDFNPNTNTGTDDTTAFVNALAAAAAGTNGSNEVVCQAKNYKITGPITINLTPNNPVILRGVKPGRIGRTTNAVSGTRLFVSNAADGLHISTGAALNTTDGVQFKIIGIGVSTTTDRAANCGISVGVTGSQVNGANWSALEDVYIEGFGFGLQVLNARLVNFTRCAVWTDTIIGGFPLYITVDSSATFTGDLRFNNCMFVAAQTDTTNAAAKIVNATNGGAMGGIHFSECDFYYGCKGVWVSNTSTGGLSDIYFTKCSVDGQGPSPAGGKGVLVSNTSSGYIHNVIWDGGYSLTYALGLRFENIGSGVMDGIRVVNSRPALHAAGGIEFDGVHNFVCNNNNLQRVGSDFTSNCAVRVLNACKHFVIDGNTHRHDWEGATGATIAWLVSVDHTTADDFVIANNAGQASTAAVRNNSTGTFAVPATNVIVA